MSKMCGSAKITCCLLITQTLNSLNYTLCIQGSLEEPAKNSSDLNLFNDKTVSEVLPISYIAAYLQSDCGFWFYQHLSP